MEIKNYKSFDKAPLQAMFDLKVPKWGNLIIKGMKLFSKNGQRWIAFPSEKSEKDGKTEYYPRLFFEDKEVMEKFKVEAIKAIDKYCLENAQKQPQTQKQLEPDPDGLPF